MKFRIRFRVHLIKAYHIAGICPCLCLGLCLGLSALGQAQNHSAEQSAVVAGAVAKEKVVTSQASGTFEVKVTPQAGDAAVDGNIGKMSLDKQFHGELEATSKGLMLAAMSGVKGSGGYVAMERVTGTLKGRSGSFVLQHIGTMTKGVPQMTVSVVPDSGTEQLVGLAGVMTIKIADGKHSYEFDYTLAEAP
ncbi:MAG TPA: DUF3224 domain-containing protein [Candidatus Sulfotelmatobacter sp.]|nr:DUF3224 domain-containing protein [Candidatus Sulfotelmatobacter sp.]